MEQREKVGPLSVRAPLSERIPNIEEYFEEFPEIPNLSGNLPRMIEHLRLEKGRLRPLSLESAANELPGSTNSGLPYFTKKNKVRKTEIERARAKIVDPNILFWRGQSGGINPEDVKQRDLFGASMAVHIREAAYMKVYFDKIRSNESFSAWTTPEGIDRAVHNVLDAAYERGWVVHSTDFSGFDKSVGPQLSANSWALYEYAYQNQFTDEIRELQYIFHNVGLILSNELAFEGEHGVGSGSVNTNLIDTEVHLDAQFHVCDKLEVERFRGNQVQGDDGLLILPPSIKVEEMHDGYAELNLDSNPDKAFMGDDDCLYLQKYYKRGIQGGMYPTYRALNSLLGQERFHDEEKWGPDMVTLRAIQILEWTKHHPLFTELVRFCLLYTSPSPRDS